MTDSAPTTENLIETANVLLKTKETIQMTTSNRKTKKAAQQTKRIQAAKEAPQMTMKMQTGIEIAPMMAKATDSERVAAQPKLRPVDIKLRVEEFKDEFFNTAELDAAISALRDFQLYGGGSYGSECFLLTGESRCGKSHLLHHFQRLALSKIDAEPIIENGVYTELKPILLVEAPAVMGLKPMLEAILLELGVPKPKKQLGIGAMTDLVVRELRLRGVQLLIIDECQHMVDLASSSAKVVRNVSEWLKGLLNRANCPIVLSGTPEAKTLYTANVQLAGRSGGRVELKPYPFSTKAEITAFRNLLRSFEQELKLPVSSNLDEAVMARCIHTATRGRIGHVSRLLAKALKFALRNQYPKIDQYVLGEVFPNYNPYSDLHCNPFRLQ